MSRLYYITHPEVDVDFTLPITRWRLSARGRERALLLLRQPFISAIARIVTSAEQKACETAALLAAHLNLEVEVREATGENDRSATGPLPTAEFEQLANRFFAEPERSVRGWERAIDAQRRVTAALADLLDVDVRGDIAVIGHGGVGTLWYCQLLGLPIERRHDQPCQGHYYSVDRSTRKPLHSWRAIDATD